jgi:hypothetical protein
LALRPDVAVINANLLPYAWYRQSLRQTHANLRLSDEEGQPLTTPSDFIEWNVSRSPIYLATLRRPPPEGYRLESSTQLQRILQQAAD